MLHGKPPVLIPYFDVHFIGRQICPIRMRPDNEEREYRIVYKKERLGVDSVNPNATMSFTFNGDSYQGTWKETPGTAEIQVTWDGENKRLKQIFDAVVTRKYSREYWRENWRHHHFLKNSDPESMEYYLPEMMKKVFCPQCMNMVTVVVMPYSNRDAGWTCIECAQPEFGEAYDYRRRQDTATDTLIDMSRRKDFEEES